MPPKIKTERSIKAQKKKENEKKQFGAMHSFITSSGVLPLEKKKISFEALKRGGLHNESIDPSIYHVPQYILDCQRSKLPNLRPRPDNPHEFLQEHYPSSSSVGFLEIQIRHIHISFSNVLIVGLTEKSHSVACYVKNYYPSFLLRLKQSSSSSSSSSSTTPSLKTARELEDIIPPLLEFFNTKAECADKKKGIYVPCLEVVMKNNAIGCLQQEEFVYKISFSSEWSMKQYKDYLKTDPPIYVAGSKIEFDMIHSDISGALQFETEAKLELQTWVRINNYEVVDDDFKSSCQLEFEIGNKSQLVPLPDKTINAPAISVFWDIERISGKAANLAPESENLGDLTTHIANSFYRDGDTKPLVNVVMGLGTHLDIPDTIVLQYSTEVEMWNEWKRMIRDLCDVDSIGGYNNIDYDLPEAVKRMKVLQCPERTFQLTRMIKFQCKEAQKRDASSTGRGADTFKEVKLPTVDQFDMCRILKGDSTVRLESYKLKYSSKDVLTDSKTKKKRIEFDDPTIPDEDEDDVKMKDDGKEEGKQEATDRFKIEDTTWENINAKTCKLDMPYELIRPYFMKDAKHRTMIAAYCLRDAMLPLKMILIRKDMLALKQLSRLTSLSPTAIITGGQQRRIYNIICKEVVNEGWLLDKAKLRRWLDSIKQLIGESYEGATVLDCDRDYHEFIFCLDFASLYPSIMRAHKICLSTMALTIEEYRTMQQQGHVFDSIDCGKLTQRYRQTNRNILPRILDRLIAARKEAKKAEEEATDPEEAANQKARQTEIKRGQSFVACYANYLFMANSLYGAFGVPLDGGILSCQPISSSVTSWGRAMLYQTVQWVESNHPGAKITYGDTDSVFVKYPLPWKRQVECPELSDAQWHQKVLEYLFPIAKKMAKDVTAALFKNPISLEFEKVLINHHQLGKKMYFSRIAEKLDPRTWDLIRKGLQSTKRDLTLLGRKLGQQVTRLLAESNDVEAAKLLVHQTIMNVLENRLPLRYFCLMKRVKKLYDKDSLPHVKAGLKHNSQFPNDRIVSGDYVNYIIVYKPGVKELSDRAEPIKTVAQNRLKIDLQHYIEGQIVAPTSKILLTRLSEEEVQQVFAPGLQAMHRKISLATTNGDGLKDMFKPSEPARFTAPVIIVLPIMPEKKKKKSPSLLGLYKPIPKK